ncbi:MAG: diguanylate cyclase [Actinomycetota bacterium]|nr:diguanylate cyclase [Actinomycetota bacterium]
MLLVSDESESRRSTERQLRRNFDVIYASGAKKAGDLTTAHNPDVIVLDVVMRDIGGKDALVRLLAEETTRDIPIIILSPPSALGDKIDALEQGAVDYIIKPAEPRELVARVRVAARLRERRHRLAARADEVTGLADRNLFMVRLTEEVARASRSSAALSILLIDVDNMTDFNHRLGRSAGDDLLRRAAGVLRSSLRLSDVLFRYGGDEFSVVLPDTDVATAYLVAERCRRAIHELKLHEELAHVSLGIAELSVGRTADELAARAETALVRAKESGGGRSWRSDDPRRRSLSTMSLSEELTEREWVVLRYLAHRHTEQEIAQQLGIRAGTVRSHKARIRRKLQVAPNTRLVDFARANLKEIASRLEDPASAEHKLD